MSQVKDLDFAIGEDWDMPFSCEDADGNVLTGTGGTPLWVLLDYHTFEVLLTATTASGITWTDQAGGLGIVSVSPAMQTAAGIEAGTYRFRFTLTLASGKVTDQAVGEFVATQRAEVEDTGEDGGESGGGSGGSGSTSSGGAFLSILPVTASRDLTNADSGFLLTYDDDTDITLTAPETLSPGFNVGIMPIGDGDVVLATSGDMVNETPYDTTSAQFGTMTVVVFAANQLSVGGTAL